MGRADVAAVLRPVAALAKAAESGGERGIAKAFNLLRDDFYKILAKLEEQ
jgi:hypothetical protein